MRRTMASAARSHRDPKARLLRTVATVVNPTSSSAAVPAAPPLATTSSVLPASSDAAAAPAPAPDAAPPRPSAPLTGLRGAARDAEIQREMERERERLWQRRRDMTGQVERERDKVLAMQAVR